MIEILGDSGDYEFLADAVQLSANVEGMCCEIGLRRGFGTKTIIDAVKQHCPKKTVISIDPFGSIPYIGREPIGPIRLDYDNTMRNETMCAMWDYVNRIGINWVPFLMTDTYFFNTHKNGVEINELETRIENKYAMVHLDGPHTIAHISSEIDFFNPRMLSGATIVIDDVTPDFINIEPIKELLKSLNWNLIKMGNKKGVWQKC